MRRILLLVLVAAVCSLPASAQEKAKELEVFSLQIEISWYVCTDPKDSCIAQTKKEGEKTCPECRRWAQKFKDVSNVVSFPESQFSYDITGGPANRQFLNVAALSVYGKELRKTKTGYPVSARALYTDPEAYGWIELDATDPKLGALAVWPEMGGLVVKESTGPGAKEALSRIQVLYPSDRKEGLLRIETANYLSLTSRPKFIVPEELVVTNIDIQMTVSVPPD